MYSDIYSCQILMNLEFSRQVFEKYSNVKFHENPLSGNRVVPCWQTDGRTSMTMLILRTRQKVPHWKPPL